MTRSASFDHFPEEARRMLHLHCLAVSKLKGTMTGEVFRITWPGSCDADGDHRSVLLRIYTQGVEVFFDLADEVQTFEGMSHRSQARATASSTDSPMTAYANGGGFALARPGDIFADCKEVSCANSRILTCLDPITSHCGRG